jgi:hypothetical protein
MQNGAVASERKVNSLEFRAIMCRFVPAASCEEFLANEVQKKTPTNGRGF